MSPGRSAASEVTVTTVPPPRSTIVGSTARVSDRLTARGLDLADDEVERWLAPPHDDHTGALSGQQPGRLPTDSGAAARHDRDPSVELSHGRVSRPAC